MSLSELRHGDSELQPPAAEQIGGGEQKSLDLTGVSDFEGFYAAISATGGIQGSRKFYSAEELLRKIEGLRRLTDVATRNPHLFT